MINVALLNPAHLIDRLPRRRKQLLAVATDTVALPFALWCALALRLGQWNPEIAGFVPAFAASVLISIPVFIRLGLYRQVVRYMGNDALAAVIKGVTVTALALAALAYMIPLDGFPRSVPVIFWLLAFVYVAGSRFTIRNLLTWRLQGLGERRPALIYGAGTSGAELARMLRMNGTYEPCAFVDDDTQLQGNLIDGLRVHSPTELAELLNEQVIPEVLVAVPSAAVAQRKRIIESLEPFSVRVRLVPDLPDLLAGRESVANIRDVEVEDLLGREAVDPNPTLLAGCVRGKAVMVTGAAGSIGSELCRQIARLEPRILVLLDHNEYGLYRIYRELAYPGGEPARAHQDLTPASGEDEEALCGELPARDDEAGEGGCEATVVPLLGSVLDATLLRRAMASYGIDTVYHAAAYKHVSLVERNVIQGIRNNTFATLYAAEAAIEAGVERFVLVSTDKAVRTTNVMGATKRMAELILQALQSTQQHTSFTIVRFGNVLGSSGSVVPLFLEQIRKGGPVTVTDVDATRFFMTIPEAAQLVLQASALEGRGELFLLDMGEPVRIMDLARKMIRLHGYRIKDAANPDGDIEIAITGLKPGEKRHEELLIADASAPTQHPKILRAEERHIPWSELRTALTTLEQACERFDYGGIRAFIERVVEGSDLAEELIDLSEPSSVARLSPPVAAAIDRGGSRR